MSADSGPDIAAIAEVAERLPSVSRLYGGRLAEIASHRPGQRILGVRLGPDAGEVEVHIVVAPGFSPLVAADDVHRVVGPLVPGTSVAVFVDDLDVDGPLPARTALPSGSVAALPRGDPSDA